MTKKFDIKKFLSDNAIIILVLVLAIVTGARTKNFYSLQNFKNLVINMCLGGAP